MSSSGSIRGVSLFSRKTKDLSTELNLESLRNELELQFERFSQRLISEDLLLSMRELMEEVLRQYVGGNVSVRRMSRRSSLLSVQHVDSGVFDFDKTHSITGRLKPKPKIHEDLASWWTRRGSVDPAHKGHHKHRHSKRHSTHSVRISKDDQKIPHESNQQEQWQEQYQSEKSYLLLPDIPEENTSTLKLCRSSYGRLSVRKLDSDVGERSQQLRTRFDDAEYASLSTPREEDVASEPLRNTSKASLMRTTSKASLGAKLTQTNIKVEVDDESLSSDSDSDESQLVKFVRSRNFDYLFCGILALNAITIGLETDYCARNWSEQIPSTYIVANWVYCFLFIIEIVLRIIVNGPSVFFTGPRWALNVFDSLVVCMQMADEIVKMFFTAAGNHNAIIVNLMRLLRYFRLLRIMRLSRAMFFLVTVRVLLVSIMASLRSLGWVLFLIALQTFIASVPLTQLATDYKLTLVDDHVDAELERFYGSMDKTMLALYEMMVEGLHWDEMMRPLVERTSPLLIVFFVFYSAFAILATMNVVTGIFVDSALQSAEESRKTSLLQTIHQAFQELEDDDGCVSLKVFEIEMMTNPNMQYFLKAIDLVPSDARQLFMLLDCDGSGFLDAEELTVGCARLQGGAKAVDLAALMYHFTKQSQFLEDKFDFLEAHLDTVAREALGPLKRGISPLQ